MLAEPVQAAFLILELKQLQKSNVDVEGHMLTPICSVELEVMKDPRD